VLEVKDVAGGGAGVARREEAGAEDRVDGLKRVDAVFSQSFGVVMKAKRSSPRLAAESR
jgi:hypothetical protein